MSDSVSGIKRITPTYPVKPSQPSSKDREPGGQRRKRPESGDDPSPPRDDDDRPANTIDEHV